MIKLSATAAALALLASPALVHPQATPRWFPLHVGDERYYTTLQGSFDLQTITGTTVIAGNEVFVSTFGPSDANDGLENYWTTDGDGDVRLWGFYRAVEGFGALYDPALRLLDAPPDLGKTWDQTVDVYSLPSGDPAGSVQLHSTVQAVGPHTVPAGVFFCVGIDNETALLTSSAARLGGYALDGRRVPDGMAAGPRAWWGEGVGEIEYGITYALTSYDVTAVLPGSRAFGALALTSPRPNPSRGMVKAELWLGHAARADVAVLDVAGRTARAVLSARWLEAGSHPVAWNGRLDSGARAPQGLYWLRVRIEGAAAARRVVLLD